jgi:pimeloyl-[acyl-carrier protein] methyl ester esterase
VADVVLHPPSNDFCHRHLLERFGSVAISTKTDEPEPPDSHEKWAILTSTVKSALKLVLLPGMDGTGELFSEFVAALDGRFDTETVRYPTERRLSYFELEGFVRAACPISGPFMLVAESFSTPLAITYAASNPANLEGLVLCAGFATSPVRRWRRFLGLLLSPLMFRVPMPELAAAFWLVGPDAPPSLLASIRTVISTVRPKVLAARFRAVLGCNVRAELSQVAVPVLYIQAKQDRLVSASCLEELRRIKPQMAVAALEGPHLLLQREPRRAAEAIVSFVRSQNPSRLASRRLAENPGDGTECNASQK